MSLAGPHGPSGYRDQRRRRLLTDQWAGSSVPKSGPPAGRQHKSGRAPQHKSANYGDALFLENPLRLVDLIPRRLVGFVLALAAGLVAIAAIEALHVWTPRFLPSKLGQPAATFDLAAAGSLAAWVSSLVLLTAGLAALAVYAVRRHKIDDYRGHYRVWLWAASCWFLMAADTGAGLHRVFQTLTTTWAGTRVIGDGSIWWVFPGLLLLGGVGSRLLLDMWPCRLSIIALLLTAGCYAAALAVHFDWLLSAAEVKRTLVLRGGLMLGHLCLLLAMGLQARYVLLDAQGLLPARRRKEAPDDAELEGSLDAGDCPNFRPTKMGLSPSADQSEDGPALPRAITTSGRRLDPPVLRPGARPAEPPIVRPPARQAVPAVSGATLAGGPSAHSAGAASAADSSARKKLTKAERKALMKRLLEERLERQRKQAGLRPD